MRQALPSATLQQGRWQDLISSYAIDEKSLRMFSSPGCHAQKDVLTPACFLADTLDYWINAMVFMHGILSDGAQHCTAE